MHLLQRISLFLSTICVAEALINPQHAPGKPALLYMHTKYSSSLPASRRASAATNYTYDELWKLQTKFYDNFLYPANVKQAESINSTIFADDVKGRVDATREFEGRELNTEYIFGLFIPSEGVSLIGQPISYDIVQFVANQNIASASTSVMFNFTNFGMQLPVTLDTWITWDENGQITQYDATFRWFGYLIQTLVDATEPLINSTSETDAMAYVAKALANSTCASHAKYCNGTNTQYDSNDDCMNFLLKEIRVGQSWELGMNTLMCRSLHEIMLKFRPDVHCPHVGKTGGGMCVDDETYVEKVTNWKYFTNSPFIAYGYAD